MNSLNVLLFCCFLSACVAAESEYRRTERYHHQVVVQCKPTERFSEHLKSLLGLDSVDPWGIDKKGRIHVRLSDQLWSELQSSLPECSVVIDNVEEYVSAAEKEIFSKSNPETSWFEAYHRYEDIVGWYQSLARNYSRLVRYVESIGTSVEGRDIPAVHFTNISAAPNHTVYFQCQIHAREWVSAAVCMYIANYLCENYGRVERVTRLLDQLQFVFIPIANPDGYEYTWTNDRLWRKNRKVNTGSSCRGVDLNRNFNDHWNEGGSSGNPCSEVYHGSFAASEPETQITQAYFAAQTAVIAAVDWHSYGQLILRPYGWSRNPPPNEEQLKAVGNGMKEAIFAVHGYRYVSEPASELYVASGGSDDWFYGDEATSTNEGYRAASYTFELRDTGTYGFLLPPNQIIPNGEEMVPAALYLAEAMLANPIHSS